MKALRFLQLLFGLLVFALQAFASDTWPPIRDEVGRAMAMRTEDLALPSGLSDEPEPDVRILYEGHLPKISVNGRILEPDFSQNYANDAWSCNGVLQMRDAGVHFHQLSTGTWHVPDGGPYDFSALDRQARLTLALDPEACLTVLIRFEMPKWCKNHPGDVVRYGACEIVPDSDDHHGSPLRGSPASAAYREEVGRIIAALTAGIRSSVWGRRVIAVVPSWGIYGEWHMYGMWNSPDMSAPMADAFHRWRSGKWSGSEVPTPAERTSGAFLMDPKRHAKALDFYVCQQEQVVGLAHFMAREIKRGLPGRLVGFPYGYVLTAQAPEGANVMMEEMLSSPNVDFLCCSAGYGVGVRLSGGSYRSRTIPSFFRPRGKMCVLDDNMSFHHVFRYVDTGDSPTRTPEETRAVVCRDYLLKLFDGCGVAFGDALRGRESRPFVFDNHDVLMALRSAKRVFAEAGAVGDESENTMAVVVDYGERLKWDAQGAGNNRMATRVYDTAVDDLSMSGVAYDLLELRDFIASDKLYSCMVFLNLFGPSGDVRRAVKAKVRRSGTTAVWLVAPGGVTPGGFSDTAMSELVGMKLKGACVMPQVSCIDPEAEEIPMGGFAKTLADGSRTIFFPMPPDGADAWAEVLGNVGVHCFVTPGICFRRHGGMMLLHVGKAGRWRVTPEPGEEGNVFVELFSGRHYPASSLEVDSNGPQTWLFRRVKSVQGCCGRFPLSGP